MMETKQIINGLLDRADRVADQSAGRIMRQAAERLRELEEKVAKDTNVLTNGNWIRRMPDKELAAFLGHSNLCVRIQHSSTWCEDHGSCDGCLEEWLKQPAEVDHESES